MGGDHAKRGGWGRTSHGPRGKHFEHARCDEAPPPDVTAGGSDVERAAMGQFQAVPLPPPSTARSLLCRLASHRARRDAFIRSQGYRILRFTTLKALGQIDGVVVTILSLRWRRVSSREIW